MQYIQYIVKQGDRWDTIAYEMYADPYLYEPILNANQQYLGLPYPPVGAILQVPVLEVSTLPNQTLVKAPWQTD